jgi:hypothetical protein
VNIMHYINNLREMIAHSFTRQRIIDYDPMIFPCGVSRSGTTLLSAILDAHSSICMGYEILFPRINNISQIYSNLENIQGDAANLREAGSLIRKSGSLQLGKWISRCDRLGISFDDLSSALIEHKETSGESLVNLRSRVMLIKRILDISKARKNASITGFKITDSSFESYLSFFPNSYFVYILRDPRDVYSSLKEREFKITLEQACRSWNKGIESFEDFRAKNPDKAFIVLYEDLVKSPQKEIEVLFERLRLPVENQVIQFHQSQARILNTSHPNASKLRKGFFSSSVNRFTIDLSEVEIGMISERCREFMGKYGYLEKYQSINEKNHDTGLYSISAYEMSKKRIWIKSQKKYKKDDYQKLLKPYLDLKYDIMTHIEYVREKEIGDRKILLIRHDVDHDHLTAQKIAKWEHERGIRSTFCLLHTAWYYGRLDGGKIRHTKDLVKCAQYIASLGHEINFHNNLVVTGLRFRIDPAQLLQQELEFFNSIGIQIKGTSTHGDTLCRKLNFRNWEIFKECCDDRFGGPRILKYENENGLVTLELGKYSMFDFGLEYEAYDMSKDVYHTDSGGNLHIRKNTRGRKDFGRDSINGSLVGILVHPIWWRF